MTNTDTHQHNHEPKPHAEVPHLPGETQSDAIAREARSHLTQTNHDREVKYLQEHLESPAAEQAETPGERKAEELQGMEDGEGITITK